MNLILELARWLGWASLIALPGAWLTFGLPLQNLSFWARLTIGATLAPLVITIEFYLIRFCGISFSTTVPLLVTVNLPVLYLIVRRFNSESLPSIRSILFAIAALTLPLLFLMPQLLDGQTRMFTGHAWMHGDITYLIAHGELWPDDPELAGIKLGYPWAGHIYQAVLSYILDSTPVSSFVWTNLGWLLLFYGLSSLVVDRLGGNQISQVAGFLWLCFGLNVVGYLLLETVPKSIGSVLWLGGDYRYTPWLLKFYFFEQILFGLGMYISLAYVLLGSRDDNSQTLSYSLLSLLLLCGIGIVYPILFVPAMILVVAKAALLYFARREMQHKVLYRQLALISGVMVVAAVVTFVHLRILSVNRVSDGIELPSLSWEFLLLFVRKTSGGIVALSLMLAGLVYLGRTYVRERRVEIALLVLAAFGSLGLNVFIEIPYWGNEYKFLFPAAICLFPFPALALQSVFDRHKRQYMAVVAITSVILALPAAHKVYKDYPWLPVTNPGADGSHFELRLNREHPQAAVFDALREQTKEDTIVVADQSELHIPTLAGRKLYAPPTQDSPHPGINILSDKLLEGPKGYDPRTIEGRRLIVRQLFTSAELRGKSLKQITSLNHPVAIVLQMPRDSELKSWLQANSGGQILHEGSGTEALTVNLRP